MFKCLGSNLQKLRIAKNKSMRDVSKDIGIPASMLSNYELDRSVPSLSNAFKLADYYGVTLEEMCGPRRKRFSLEQEDTDEEGH